MGYYLSAFCLPDLLSLHQKSALPVAGRAPQGVLCGFCKTESYDFKQITNIIIALLHTFMGIEDVVTKQLGFLQFVVALDF